MKDNQKIIKKVAIVTSHPIQYQVPFFRELSTYNDIDLTVFFATDHGSNPDKIHPGFDKAFAWDIPILDGYKYIFLRNSKPNIGVNDWRVDGPELKSYFNSEKYDAVMLFGWDRVFYWQAIWWARRNKIPLILRAESHMRHIQSWHKKLLKKLLFPSLFKQFSGFMSIGSLNTEMYSHFGVPENKIYLAPYCVDNTFFSNEAKKQREDAISLRDSLGIRNDDTVFLLMGKLVEYKRPLDLIKASALINNTNNFHVIFVGGGPLKKSCKTLIENSNLSNIHLIDFVNQSKLPTYYAAADVSVLPSQRETWGLVVNEGMASGLPAIVSDSCGCAPDLVLEDYTGYIYQTGDVKRLSELMENIIINNENRKKMGRNASEYIKKFSISSMVSTMNEILNNIYK